ncbi:MAG: hypothetical protein K2H74_08305 [Paramuribaculum sp.]|nr:hypothetical protein [Paramuribaculum sp.]
MEDRKLTEKESLEVITSMIARTKHRYLGNGNILLMWGYLTVAVSILVWLLLATTHENYWNWLWFAIPLIGGIATPIMARRQQVDGVTTYSDKVTSRLWAIFGISEILLTLCCLGFKLFGGVYCWSAMLVYTLIAAPAAEIAQGLIVRESSLTGGGLAGLAVGLATVCCVTGGITLYAYWFMPLFILAFTAMMIVPGHIINHKYGCK